MYFYLIPQALISRNPPRIETKFPPWAQSVVHCHNHHLYCYLIQKIFNLSVNDGPHGIFKWSIHDLILGVSQFYLIVHNEVWFINHHHRHISYDFYLIVHNEVGFIHPPKTRGQTATVEPNNHCNFNQHDWVADADADAGAYDRVADADADDFEQPGREALQSGV